jgi:membrane protein implicated in regulation of membrane protease activity
MDLLGENWFWWALALLLLAAEALVPGVFLLWLGLAAGGTGVLKLLMPGMAPVAQWIAFSFLSLVSVGVAWQIRRRSAVKATDQPLLNQRSAQLLGRVYPLDTAIVNGRGRLKIGDAYWHVEGPDAAAGARVRIVGVHDMVLRVVAVD